MSDNRIRPFANGTQYADWEYNNCASCKKGAQNNGDKLKCEIDEALLVACFDDGSVSADIGKRMGYKDESPPRYIWNCGELVTS